MSASLARDPDELWRDVRRVQEVAHDGAGRLPFARLLREDAPVIFRGFAKNWPLVRDGLESPEAAMAHIESFYGGRPVLCFEGPPEMRGRFGYTKDLTGLDFKNSRAPLSEVLDRIRVCLADPENAPSIYVGSTDMDLFFPGLGAANALSLDDPMFAGNPPVVSLWIGNHTIAAAHYDYSNNVGICAVGRRRFTLFPPGQVANLYPGPLEPTPGGQVISMVDFAAPDFERYPRFAEAMQSAQIAELEPGDALFFPAMWWHQVEATAPFNILVNYWWNTSPAHIDSPQVTLLHALLSIRDRPEPEKRAWREVFDYYVFGPADRPAAHLPEHARGNLAPIDEAKARRLRALLLHKLNR